ncbi:MarR family winged helix-turn-helix transcriptional regulator [Catenisphaera adipataccumulans]|uniref:MarR family multiple gene transcriptional regulator MgrA n=1 Tax=Catenisphaera adipataccumulans TaxID=700500 RepID=A0A7W8FWF3_9FIRM|nr:MarR family transcriptional regulator [Catenisphaera adipataccumulans]MBB5182635.1 MarR family multiple gene transcriptional regulator MgrA [Catenisphaera adipataccumulans]
MKNNKGEYVDCGMLIKQISDHIQSHSNRQLNKVNLTATQFRYLEYMKQSSEPVSFKDVEKHFQTSQPTVSGIMKRMAEKNLIVIEDADFGRAKNARLTEKGQALVDDSGIERENEEKLLLSALQEDERELFHDMLERINKKLSE